ncbi:MAG TPA: hypothetical protein VL651_09000 [Bacteroidia bacterium]|jgi:hypothetical protein|nr:hypothetical protein [Bacteroidia bacterium]
MQSKDEIRVALLCRGTAFDAWEAESVKQVMSLPYVKIVLLVNEKPEATSKPSFFKKIVDYPWSILSWRLLNRFRLKIPANQKVDLTNELKGIPSIEVLPERKGKFSEYFSEHDLRKVKEHAPDLILRFAFNILRGEILTVAKYGVWSFHHADEQIIRGGPAAFWEIYFNLPKTGAILQRLTEKLDGGIILRKGYFRTIRRSYKANLDQLLMGTTSWMKQAVIDVHNGISPAENGTPVATNAVLYKFPRNRQMFRFRWIQRKEKWKFHFAELFKAEKWTVAILDQSPTELLEGGIVRKPDWLTEMPRGKYIADPFGWRDADGKLQVVAEEYDYKKRKGVISAVRGDEKKNLLPEKHHLSYPFVLRSGKEIKILPEAFQSGELSAYDLAGNKKVILKNFAAVDATPIEYKGKWWLFCTEGGDLSNTALHIFHADSFDGEWKPHENNPVKWDISSARPAGTLFVANGKLYRPSQDCSTTYGAAVVLNEITDLSEKNFSEKQVSRIETGQSWKFNKGLHTVSIVDDKTILIDAKRYEFNLPNFSYKLGQKLRKLFGS